METILDAFTKLMKNIHSLSLSLSQTQFFKSLFFLLIFSAFIRFYQLGLIPHGMTWDEAAIGYNGYAIFTTRRDEWLQRLPLSFWSFGDYKAPLAIYLNGFFTFAFGLNLWAVRLPFTIASIFSIWGMTLLAKNIFDRAWENEGKSRFLAVVAGALFATSPWHFHYSRAGFESGLALCFVIWGTYFWYQSWKNHENIALLPLLSSVILLTVSLYTYHSTKIMVPFFVFFLVLQQRRFLWKNRYKILTAAITGISLISPFIYDSIWGKGLERAGTLIFSQGYSLQELIKHLLQNIFIHFTPGFLLFGETTTLRHGDGQWGVFLLTSFLTSLIALGLFLFSQKFSSQKKLFSFSLFWILVGFLPAIIGNEVPHSNRALLALPGTILLATLGLKALLEITNPVIQRLILGSFFLFHTLLFTQYLQNYFTIFARESASAFQDGYIEAFHYVIPYEKGTEGKQKVEKVIFTSEYGQPYIYALFTRKTNPIWYQGGSLNSYEFKDTITIGDLERPNTVVVASEKDDLLSRNENPDHIVRGSDGSPRFRIYIHP